MPQELTAEIVRAAIAGFEQQRLQIDAQLAELRAMIAAGNREIISPGSTTTKRRRFSGASHRKMALAQRARWARIRGESALAPAETPKPKRRLSAAARKAIGEGQRRRWAQKRAKAARAQSAKKSAPGHKVATQTRAT
jgi:hypothetical protein